MRLSEARIGQEFEILAVRIPREIGRRLADMGFTEGARGRIVRGGAFRGPLQVRIRDYDVLLRRCEAAGIEILLLAPSPGESAGDAAPEHGHRGFGRRGGGRKGWPGFGRRHGAAGRRGACPDYGDPQPRETEA